MTSLFTRTDIKISDKIASNLYVKSSIENYNSVIMKRQTRKFYPQTNSSYNSNQSNYISIKTQNLIIGL